MAGPPPARIGQKRQDRPHLPGSGSYRWRDAPIYRGTDGVTNSCNCCGRATRSDTGLHTSGALRKPFCYNRARDVVNLLLLHVLTETTGHPSLTEIRAAVEDIFAARLIEAEATDAPSRSWPARLTVHPHWGPRFAKAADSAGLTINTADAVAQVNAWLDLIERA